MLCTTQHQMTSLMSRLRYKFLRAFEARQYENAFDVQRSIEAWEGAGCSQGQENIKSAQLCPRSPIYCQFIQDNQNGDGNDFKGTILTLAMVMILKLMILMMMIIQIIISLMMLTLAMMTPMMTMFQLGQSMIPLL